MKKFTLGVAAGMTSLAIAVPLLAQGTLAASSIPAAGRTTAANRPVPTQACIQAMAQKDELFLSHIDAMTSAQKTATQAHKAALTAAAGITDDTQRRDALKKAEDDFRTAMQAAIEANKADMDTLMQTIRTACGNTRGLGMGLQYGSMMSGDVDDHLKAFGANDRGKAGLGRMMRGGRWNKTQTPTGASSSSK